MFLLLLHSKESSSYSEHTPLASMFEAFAAMIPHITFLSEISKQLIARVLNTTWLFQCISRDGYNTATDCCTCPLVQRHVYVCTPVQGNVKKRHYPLVVEKMR